jgi:hypothetical protein
MRRDERFERRRLAIDDGDALAWQDALDEPFLPPVEGDLRPGLDEEFANQR